MTMTISFRTLTSLTLLTITPLIHSGCAPGTSNVSALAETVVVGPEYSTKGIFVPEETRRSLGLTVVAIGEQPISTTVPLTLRVFASNPAGSRASAWISAAESAAMKPGQPVAFTTPDGVHGSGTIIALRDDLKRIAGEVEVLAELPADASIAVGTFLAATVNLGDDEVVTSVPRSALIRGIDGHFVYTVSGEHFVRTPVVVGAMKDAVAEVTDGLYSGDEVVSEPAMALWLTELAAIKGGHACCAMPAKGK